MKSKGKYRKVNTKPLGLIDSQNLRNYALDNSVSRTGYLKPRQVKPSPSQYDINPNYARNTKSKFRSFRQKKGKRTQLQKYKKIELGRNLIDTIGEKSGLKYYQVLAKKRKKADDFANPFLKNQKKKKNSKKKKLNNVWEMP